MRHSKQGIRSLNAVEFVTKSLKSETKSSEAEWSTVWNRIFKRCKGEIDYAK